MRFRWPRLTWYRVAEPQRFKAGLNTYGHGWPTPKRQTIGAYLVIRKHCLSLRWARPS